MKKTLLLLGLIIFLFSCKNKQEKLYENVKCKIRKYIEDVAFKQNEKVNLLQYDLIRIDTIKRFNVYLFNLEMLDRLIKDIADKSENEVHKMSELSAEIALYNKIGMDETITGHKKRELKKMYKDIRIAAEKSKKIESYMDSITNIIKTQPQKNIDSLYRAKIFIKAIQTRANGSTYNIMDTMYFLLNKKYKPLPKKDFVKEFGLSEWLVND